MVPKSADRGNCQIPMIDFNPYNMHNVPSDLPGKLVVEQPGTLLSCSIFAEGIEMGLGCMIYTAPEAYDFDRLLMEEEQLVVCIYYGFPSIYPYG